MFKGPYDEKNLPGPLAGGRYWSESEWTLETSAPSDSNLASHFRVTESAGDRSGLIMCEKPDDGGDLKFSQACFSIFAYAPRILLDNVNILNAACRAPESPDESEHTLQDAANHCRKTLDELKSILGFDPVEFLDGRLTEPVLRAPQTNYFGIEVVEKTSGDLVCLLPLNIDYENAMPGKTKHEVRARWCEISLILHVASLAQNCDTLAAKAEQGAHLSDKIEAIFHIAEKCLMATMSRPDTDLVLFGVHHCDVCGDMGVWPLYKYRSREAASHRPDGFGAEFSIELDKIPEEIHFDHDTLLENRISTEVVCPNCFRL